MALQGVSVAHRVAVLRRGACAVAAMLALALASACGTLDAGSAQARAAESAQVLDRLYFGRAMPQGGEVSNADWDRFIAEVVSPLQPGLTFMPARGQWREPSGAVVREEVFVLELVRENAASGERAVETIVDTYKRRFGQQSVMWVRHAIRASF